MCEIEYVPIKVTTEELANHLVEVTFTRLHIKLKIWLASQQDRVSTNKCCLKIEVETKG